jgi:3-oxoacyl-[acyl-carrier protein] reductase
MSTVHGRLDGKIAIVTGGASGFGEAMVRLFTAQGARVVIGDLDAAKGQAAAASVGDAAHFVRCDVSNRADIDGLVQACVGKFGTPDIVVNNAGMTHENRPMLSVDEETFDRVFAVNVKSIYHMTQAVLPLLRERGRGGVILNIGSTAGIRPRPGLSWYNASKGAVNVLSKSMAVELAPEQIRVNAICPVMGVTGLFEQFMGLPDTPENRARFVSTIPLGRFSQPSDVAAVAVFLGSDAAEFITGVEFPVDGGRTI